MCDCGPRNYYRYYDTPEGCNIDRKVMTTARYGIVTGLIASTYDVLMFSHAIHLVPMLKRYAYHTIPLGLMGATFSLVANSLVRIRETDDHLNYFAGGLACGPIVAAYLKSAHGVLLGGLALGVIAMIKKEAIETGFQFMPTFPSHMNTIDDWRRDWTIAKDPRDGLLQGTLRHCIDRTYAYNLRHCVDRTCTYNSVKWTLWS